MQTKSHTKIFHRWDTIVLDPKVFWFARTKPKGRVKISIIEEKIEGNDHTLNMEEIATYVQSEEYKNEKRKFISTDTYLKSLQRDIQKWRK